MQRYGKIDIICGPMFSGKTTELLRRLERLDFANKKYLLFKPSFDDRYSKEDVVSHTKKKRTSIPVKKAKDILDIINNDKNRSVVYIAIDEAQFFSRDEKYSLVDLCLELKKRNIKILLNGLDMDCAGKPFGLMPELLAIADSISKLTAICMYRGCGNKAQMSYKKEKYKKNIQEDNYIQLGENDIYEARCFKHWLLDE